MKKQLIPITAIAAILSLASCKKSNTATGISYQVKTVNPTTTLAKANPGGSTTTARELSVQAGTITWNSGYASATEIQFEAESAGTHVIYKTEKIMKLDLFSPLTSLGNIAVPQGVYKTVEFEIELASNATEAALELKGMYNNVPVTFRVINQFELEAEQDNVTIADGKNYNALTALNLAILTQGISGATFDAATKDGTGTIIISATSNTDIYDKMIANLQNCEDVDFQ